MITITSVTSLAPQWSHSEDIRLAKARRETLSTLNEFDHVLQAFRDPARNDPLAEPLSVWAAEFRAMVDSPRFSLEEKGRFFLRLKTLLQDTVPCSVDEEGPAYSLVDSEALLGSDGFVYGKRLLSICLDMLPEDRRTFSIKNPREKLSLEPHQPARFLIGWLTQESAYTPDPTTEEIYSSLFSDRTPFLPMKGDLASSHRMPTAAAAAAGSPSDERLAQLRERQRQRKAERNRLEAEHIARELAPLEAVRLRAESVNETLKRRTEEESHYMRRTLTDFRQALVDLDQNNEAINESLNRVEVIQSKVDAALKKTADFCTQRREEIEEGERAEAEAEAEAKTAFWLGVLGVALCVLVPPVGLGGGITASFKPAGFVLKLAVL